MKKEIEGTVISVSTQWWLKVNRKPFRTNILDGAEFPHIIKVRYTVNGETYEKRKWFGAGENTPPVGGCVMVSYEETKPKRAKVL